MAIEYKAYAIGPDDLTQLRVDLICADDEAAKEHPRAWQTAAPSSYGEIKSSRSV